MVLDGLRAYVQLAGGLSEVTRQKAVTTARTLLEQNGVQLGAVPGQFREQVAGLADELVATSRANRELIVHLVEGEVERVAARLGLVSGEEFERLRARVEDLESRLEQKSGAAEKKPGTRKAAPTKRQPAKGRSGAADKKAGAEPSSDGSSRPHGDALLDAAPDLEPGAS